MTSSSLDISQTVKKIPRSLGGLPYYEMKDAVLGKGYELSLVFVSSSLSRRLNKSLRGKDKPANILSLPVSENLGEIFIDVKESAREAKMRREDYANFVQKLFIHGLLHLKGMDHGDTMEKAEMKFFKKFHL